MARKNVIPSHKMIENQVLTSNITSNATNVTNLDRASVSIDWSGSDAVGTITFEAKKQKIAQSSADSDWSELDFGSVITINGTSGHHDIIFNSLDFTDLRVKFNYTSGTAGVIDSVITAKTVGA